MTARHTECFLCAWQARKTSEQLQSMWQRPVMQGPIQAAETSYGQR
eukprot:jgi/Antlo1/1174/1080